MKKTPETNPRDIRTKLGLNQAEFWNPLGVTQSCGSRLENGRPMAEPYKILLTIAYGTEKQSAEAVKNLRSSQAEGKR